MRRLLIILPLDAWVGTIDVAIGRVQLSVYPSFCLKGLMHDE